MSASHFVYIRPALANRLVCGQSHIPALSSDTPASAQSVVPECIPTNVSSDMCIAGKKFNHIVTPDGVAVWLQRSPIATHASHLLCMPSFAPLQNPECYKFRCMHSAQAEYLCWTGMLSEGPAIVIERP